MAAFDNGKPVAVGSGEFRIAAAVVVALGRAFLFDELVNNYHQPTGQLNRLLLSIQRLLVEPTPYFEELAHGQVQGVTLVNSPLVMACVTARWPPDPGVGKVWLGWSKWTTAVGESNKDQAKAIARKLPADNSHFSPADGGESRITSLTTSHFLIIYVSKKCN